MPMTIAQKQIITRSVAAGVLFFGLSLPQTYALTTRVFGFPPGSMAHIGVHAAVYAAIVFALMSYMNN